MSEVAGCLAPQVGAQALMRSQGGRGILLGGIGGVPNGRVVILGAGVAGQNAASIALGLGADVTLLDTDLEKLRACQRRWDNRVHTLASTSLAIRDQVPTPPGRPRSPRKRMRATAVSPTRTGSSASGSRTADW